jgi:two-component system, OmpR family, sensor histidine kinase KdpD
MKDRISVARLQSWKGYLLGIGLVALANLLGYLVKEFFAPENIIMFFLLCITVSAVFGGLGPSILVSILSVLSYDFFFVPPHFTFAVADTQYIFTFIALLFVAFIISYLTSRVREQTEAARHSEQEMAALAMLGRDLAISSDLDSYARAIVSRIKETLGISASLLLPDPEDSSKLKNIKSDGEGGISDDEMQAAKLSFKNRRITGFETRTFPELKSLFMPLFTPRGSIGVLMLHPGFKKPDRGDKQLLAAYSDLAARAIEGIQLAEALHNAQILKATEKLQTALLNAISHDLRTPLVSVIGVLSSLQEEIDLDSADKKNLIEVAREEADRLNHLIANLLDESRIEAGAVRLNLQLSEMEDLVGAALEQLGSRAATRQIMINMPQDLPFISVDFGLVVETLVNVIDNALKYSPADAPVNINAAQKGDFIEIEVADRGTGIRTQDLPHVFDRFYRIQHPSMVSGTGLGLSISKGIIEAHGGSISAENRPGGGTIIRFSLPLKAAEPGMQGK